MNRFSTYIDAARLARMMLVQAEGNLQKGNTDKAVRDTIGAMKMFMTSMNNIASLLREPRRKIKLTHERKKTIKSVDDSSRNQV